MNVRSHTTTMHASQPVWLELPHKSVQQLHERAWLCAQVLLNELALLSSFAWETATLAVLWYFSMAGDGTMCDRWLSSAKRFFCFQTHADEAARVAKRLDDDPASVASSSSSFELVMQVLMQVCPHPLAMLVWGAALLILRALKWYCSAPEADTMASGLCFLLVQDWAILPAPV
ncbi:hypothetical protein GY45DRAFT_1320308 [Cubamyces sp. BRFM 1775]|nr:hypothetical protein GY45DRAFT_1320308 [Cubamyces sp. BRFM 1775]